MAVKWTAGADKAPYLAWASYNVGETNGHVTSTSTTLPMTVAGKASIDAVTFSGKLAWKHLIPNAMRDSDNSNAQRCEVGQGNPGKTFSDGTGDRQFRQGDEIWLSEWIYVPSTNCVPGTGASATGFFSVNQWKVAGTGGPPLSMAYYSSGSNHFAVDHALSTTYGSTNGGNLWNSPAIVRDRWFKWTWHILFHMSAGFVEVYSDIDNAGYRLIMPRFNGATLKFGSDGNPGVVHLRQGPYRGIGPIGSADTIMYFAGTTCATTRAEAETGAGFTAAAAGPAPTAAFTWSPTSPNTGQVVTFDASTSTAGTGSTITQYAWDLDGTTALTGVSPTFTFSFTGVKHATLTVTQSDGQTSSVAHDITVGADVTAPDTTITSPTTGSTVTTTNPSVAFTSSETPSTFEGRVDGGAWAPVTSPWVTPTLANGSHTIDVRATDQAGNVDATPASITITVSTGAADVTPPQTTITAPASGATVGTATPTVEFTADEPSTFEGRVDAGAWAARSSPWQLAALTNGSHTVDVRATDLAGNVDATPASVTFTVNVTTDTTAPNTTILSPVDGATLTQNRIVFSYAADEPSTFEASVDGTPWISLGQALVSEIGGLDNGAHVLQVRATDLAGNVETDPAAIAFTVAVQPVEDREKLILNGVDLNPGADGAYAIETLDVTPPAPRLTWVRSADSEHSALADPRIRHEDRTITLGVRIAAQATEDAALALIGQVQDQLVAGAILEWTPSGSTQTVEFTVMSGEITELPISGSGDGFLWFQHAPSFTVVLTCEPYGLMPEVATAPVVTADPVASVDVLAVAGDAPPDARLIITEVASQTRRHVEFGVQSRGYVPAAPPPVLVDAVDLTVTGFAGTRGSLPGAYGTGSNVVVASALPFPVRAAGLPRLPHVGAHRVKARVNLGATTTKIRLAWQAGDGPLTANGWADAKGTGFRELDLGTIIVASADQTWTGQVEVWDPDATTGNQTWIDYLMVIPCGDGYGVARALFTEPTGTVLNAFDNFTGTTAGSALNGRAALAGGAWATSGATTDFAFADYHDGEVASRTTTLDAGPRIGLLGTAAYQNVESSTLVFAEGTELGSNDRVSQGVVARYVDASNYLRLYWSQILRSNTGRDLGTSLILEQVVGGSVTKLAETGTSDTRQWFRVRLWAYDSGRIVGKLMSGEGVELARVEASSASAATSGPLASGKAGIYDMSTVTGGMSRYYDEPSIATLAPENAVLYPTRSLQVDSEGAVRADATGAYWGRPTSYKGPGFRLMPGNNRVVAKGRRNDVTEATDSFVEDALQYQVAYRPRVLVVPRP